ncbi:MAG: 5-bromo-4-chloroindolyl phosphate hydrolysis family protein [Lachnospiraceae bacterium]|jgi:uncharacterized membrane protein|nr:5-bromo-4-chloroindolyl phosphate hydrolysis family protein [Lachnospiraceae bacterium]MDY2759848.1 5-bromo-4-chloroindolyl phosphate hydrolysis family protein [Lachnospiraceae bacterium]
MGVNEDIGRAADEIIDRVTDAVMNGNYKHLSQDLGQTVKKNQQIISESIRSAGRPHVAHPQQGTQRQNGTNYNPYAAGASAHNTMQQAQDMKMHHTPFMRQVLNVNSLAASKRMFRGFVTTNIVIVVVFAVIALITGLTGSRSVSILMIVGACVFGMLAAIFAHFLNGTKKEQELNSIFIKYQHIIGNSEYFSIDDLCVKTGQAKDEVVADFKRLMSAGMLPGASIDSGKTTLILSDYARIEYKNLLRNEQNRQEADKGLPQEAIDILQKGDEYIARIHMANDLIPGEAMSDKLDDLENIMKKIFAEVRKNPEKSGGLRRLMDYYLPTTLKLVEAYADMDTQPETENIASSKKEIENSLDVINQACTRIFDEMFEDENWDITSDINVMKTMMKQDGLVDDDSTMKTGNQ